MWRIRVSTVQLVLGAKVLQAHKNNYMTLTIGIKYQIETSILAGYYDEQINTWTQAPINQKKKKKQGYISVTFFEVWANSN